MVKVKPIKILVKILNTTAPHSQASSALLYLSHSLTVGAGATVLMGVKGLQTYLASKAAGCAILPFHPRKLKELHA